MSLSMSGTFSGTGAAWVLLSTEAPEGAETTVTLLATLVPFSSAGAATTRARAPGASGTGRTAPRSYVNRWYWLSSVRTTKVFRVEDTTVPSTAFSSAGWEDEVLSWHCAGTAMRGDRNRTEQARIRARMFILLLLARLQGSILANCRSQKTRSARALSRYCVNPICESRRG